MRIQDLLTESPYITVHRTLNTKLWTPSGEMLPEVRAKLLIIADRFRDFISVDDFKVIDVTVTGSNAAYTYSSASDLDLHLIVQGLPSDEERELYDAKKGLWNQQRDIMIRGLPVEVYVQGSDEQHHSSGVYSVLKDSWIIRPKKARATIDDVSVNQRLRYLTREIQGALNDSDPIKANAVKARISKMRKTGLAKTGEWGPENIAFKTLRNQGLIDQLSQHILNLEDQALSLEAVSQLK
jgi:hypothetical protein